MLEQVKILSSRRAYEFRQDDLRLTMLSTRLVQQQFQDLFSFQTSAMGSPAPTFGAVPATYPPGFVFDMGVWISPDQQPVPIRFLHFEQRRIVIDVAGSSASIAAIFAQVKTFFSDLHAPDGSPVIGEPERILDFSEITAQYPFSLDALIAEPVRTLLKGVLPESNAAHHTMLSTLSVQVYPVDKELAGVPSLADFRSLSFAPRAGTRPQDHIYFSSASLDSETHLHYLHELEATISS
ncbi:MAG TPA: hypothetical protein VGF67_22615 [Ktedonobacteraceae bacterium]|jgi:hypothetical protein